MCDGRLSELLYSSEASLSSKATDPVLGLWICAMLYEHTEDVNTTVGSCKVKWRVEFLNEAKHVG